MRHPLARPGLGFCSCILALMACAAPAAAKSYSASRFDSVVRVLPDGTLDVTETVVFRFEDGTFREVFREIPMRRTDGIEIVRADMQGQRLPFGRESGTVEIRRRNGRMRVIWRFSPVEQVTREFVLNYLVRGAVRQEGDADILAWRGTPGEHHYAIESSTIRFDLPVSPVEPPAVTTRKTAEPVVSVADRIVRVQAASVRENGWIDTVIRLPRGSVVAAAPAWQRRAAYVATQGPPWLIGAMMVVVAGLIMLVAWRQGYEPPPGDSELGLSGWDHAVPPDSLTPALSGIVAANGRAALEHAMAAVFFLAERGEIDIQEKPPGVILGQRDFVLTRRRGTGPLSGHEQRVLELIYKSEPGAGATVTLSRARTLLTRKFRRFSAELERELTAAGLLDARRRAIRGRYNGAGAWLLVLAALAIVPAAFLVSRQGPWPLLIPAAVAVVAVLSFIFATTTTPLSNEGVRRGHRWRRYRKYLTSVAQGKTPSTGLSVAAVLPYAIALGLAGAWSKFLKAQRYTAPAWFHASSQRSDQAGFIAFIAYGGAGSSAGGGGASGAGGAAGGGSSGAH